MTTKELKSKVVTIASKIKKQSGCTQSLAFKKAWIFVKALNTATYKAASLTFIKKDGTVRPITFMTMVDLLPFEKQPKTETAKAITLAKVYDLTIGEWRSFQAWQVVA
ncbi:MAG: DUF2693 domain-containing protein [Saprospiraceae bacterium]|nr:DUF2693 domain-containing protein [Saprospiraceae bacterium]